MEISFFLMNQSNFEKLFVIFMIRRQKYIGERIILQGVER
jgi:hypothetical protein